MPLFVRNVALEDEGESESQGDQSMMTQDSASLRAAMLVFCVLLFALALSRTASAHEPTITPFDVPASNGYGTVVADLAPDGTIVGFYFDANLIAHGFLRSPQGEFTTFDAPGAGTKAKDSNGTFALGINLLGVVVGYYNDDNLVSHCFVRSADGKITTFDAPGADTNPADAAGSQLIGINPLGVIVGSSEDSSFVLHGFLRELDGQFTSFDAAPGAIATFPNGPINPEGALVGFYLDSNELFHAFVRNPGGNIATFVGPGSCDTGTSKGCYGTGDLNINILGWSVGAYMDNKGNFINHGFLRSPDGTFTFFDAPGAGSTGIYQGTIWSTNIAPDGNEVAGLNDSGAVAATYLDSNNVYHGFLRSPAGNFTSFDAPGADLTAGDYNGTFPVSINDVGLIAGTYTDALYVPHGFVREPQ
jgi:hypothetical protein